MKSIVFLSLNRAVNFGEPIAYIHEFAQLKITDVLLKLYYLIRIL